MMTSTHTVLDSLALGYQPVWNRARQLAAVRMPVLVLHRESVDGEHFVRALGNDWPKAAPSLIIAPRSLHLVDQLLHLPHPGCPFMRDAHLYIGLAQQPGQRPSTAARDRQHRHVPIVCSTHRLRQCRVIAMR